MKITGNSPDLAAMFPKRTWMSAWKSQESFARYIETREKNTAWCDSGWDSDEEFSGTPGMQDALKLAKDGWKDGVEAIDKMAKMIYALNPILKQPIKYGVAGAFPNVPRAIAGNPLNMHQYDSAKSKRRQTITIASNMCEPYFVGKDAITNKASAVVAIVDLIEAKGYSCDVVAIAGSQGHRDKYNCMTTVLLKESHQPLDKGKMAFGLGHSSMFRRLIFADWGTEPTAKDGLGYGLGHAGEVSPSADFASKNIFIIPSGGSSYFKDGQISATKGINWLIYCLQQQGCPAFTTKGFRTAVEASRKVIRTKSGPKEEDELFELEEIPR